MWASLAIITVLIIILFFLTRGRKMSKFELNDETWQKSRELLSKGVSFSEFKTHLNVDNVEFNDLKQIYKMRESNARI